MKKIFFLLLAFFAITSNVFAYDTSINVNGKILYFNIVNGEAQVTYQNNSYPRYTTNMSGTLVIPSSVPYGSTTYSVTSIGNYAFEDCSGLTSVTIPNSVTSIGNYAFEDCSGLTSVTIPNSVTSIGSYAFSGCSSLSSFTIPNSVISIGSSAFSGCSGLTSITIPNSVTSIGWWVFNNCSGLTSVTIPNSFTSIPREMFKNCSSLTSITIPYSVTSIEYGAFQGCSSLSSFAIPLGVISIGDFAFQGCSGLTSVIIPVCVTSIGDYAFQGCSGLTSVIFTADSCTSAGSELYPAFFGCTNITSFSFAIGVKIIPSYLCWYMSGLTSVTIPNSVTSIGNFAFFGCNGLTSVAIPNSVTTIGTYAFNSCGGLDTVHMMPATPPELGYNAFFLNASGRVFILNGCSYDNYYNSSSWYSYRNALREPDINITVSVLSNNSERGSCGIIQQSNHDIRCDSSTVIQATANYGYHFDHWDNGNTANPDTLRLVGDTSVTAIFAKNQYTITGLSSDTIKGNVTGSATVNYLDTVTLMATASYGYHFLRWNDNNTTNPRSIIATNNITKTATFAANQYHISLYTDTSIHGSCTGSGNFNYMSQRTISATANYGYHFTAWNDGDTTNPRTITLTRDTAFTALFAKNSYSVSVVSADTVQGNATGNTTMEYLDSVGIAATANYGYHFSHWNDGDTTNPRFITLTQDTVLTAYFTKNWYAVIGISSNETMGYVTGGDMVEYLDSVSLLATSNYGYHFSSWNDGDTNNPRVFCITQDTTFTALFAKNQYTLTVQSNDETQGSVSDGGVFEYLDTASIIASASEHYHFVRWDDGNTDNPREYVIVGDATLTAIFAIDTHTVTVTPNDIARGMVEATGSEFSYGTPCTVTATAYTGYVFTHWSNGITANPYTFAVLEDTELIAIFEEDGTQGIDDVAETDNIRIFSKYDRIIIDGLNGQDVTIYTIDGRTIASLPRATEHVAIPITTTGVYIVKIGNHPARKVVVIK